MLLCKFYLTVAQLVCINLYVCLPGAALQELDTTPNQYNVVDYNAHDKDKGKK